MLVAFLTSPAELSATIRGRHSSVLGTTVAPRFLADVPGP